MKKMFMILLCTFLFIPLVKSSDISEPKEVNKIEENKSDLTLAPKAKSAILIESSTGKILFEKNSHEKLAPASMTKIMSMLIIIESIEKKVINWNDMITISENASNMGGSQILLEYGEKMSVSDLFKGVAVASGNDAVVALAETIAGSTEEFVKMMNTRAKELGLKDTNFKNPHGLDEANHYSSAYDMSIIAKELVKHEKVLKYTSIYEDYLRKKTTKEFWLVNTNKLVRFYEGADGLKTGFTEEAGYCLTATASKNNVRLISVVMNEETSSTRNSETTSLLDYGFAKIKVILVAKKEKIISKINIDKMEEKYVGVVPIKDVKIVKYKTESLGKITYDLELKSVKAPIKVGEIIGKLKIKENNKIIEEVDLTVEKDVKKAKLFSLYYRYLSEIINGKINL